MKQTLSPEEMEVINKLVEAWSAWLKLESLHPDETPEFRLAIHNLQNIVMSRPVKRQINKESK